MNDESRPPTQQDLVSLCRELNDRGAKYIVIGGFAMMHAGYPRFTADIDLLVDTAGDNEKRVLDAVGTLPDHAALQLKPGEIAEYTVVRVADEVVVDLLATASGISYDDIPDLIQIQDVDGVQIPFASADALWKMKGSTLREKDKGDAAFLRQWFVERGRDVPPLDK